MSLSNLINLMTLIWNLPLNFDVAFCNWLDKFFASYRMNQVTIKCLVRNSKSSYLMVEGETKPLASALDKILSILTYG